MLPSFDSIVLLSPVKNTIKSLFDGSETEVITRRASYVIKRKNEVGDNVTRIILLPPTGFTANQIKAVLSHPEVRQARATIYGAVRQGNQRFSRLKNCLKFCYYLTHNVEVIDNYPSALIDITNVNYREEVKSAQQTFFAVKENGEGFYYNLINLTEDWLLLVVKKELASRKKMDVKKYAMLLDSRKQKMVFNIIDAVKRNGDELFIKDKSLVESLLELRADEAIPSLIEALNICETGKHEPCTVYAVILKFGKKDRANTLEFLNVALKHGDAPKYYLEELIGKLS